MKILAALALLLAPITALAQQHAPGTLVNAEPMQGALPGSTAWRIRYTTTSDKGTPITVTGVVIAPTMPPPPGGRAVIAWTHGAWGVVEKCTPSLSPNFFAATPALPGATARGYVVVAPDYAGLGSNVPHPFLVGTSTAHAVLDAVRAVQGLPEAGAAPGRFAVWGESQGGHAALWTWQLARSYAPELTLVGAAAAAPPTDLVQNLTSGSDPSVRAFMTAFAAYSWSEHFGAPLSTLGNKSTAGVISRLARNNCVTLGAKPKLGTMLGVLVLRRDLRNVDLGRIQPWARIARANSVPARPTGVPLLIGQNPKDVLVAPAVTHAYAQRLCRAGGQLRYVTITGKGHETSAHDMATTTLDWIDARFAGKPAPSNCGAF